ncbi:hypothetical protein VCJ71_12085 [Alteriqipengyuania sp. WL0013]|uniref:hypothetical protein n=1 Tax=Alteriqipengyuania sp. WL0013 TaxID=3110773 RepID=UPI002C6D985E|nr:hypothetical protein [Alteriqipengyuania sp. WL0013]MEB3416802.1 hypothetical protein [Alteriqipengyuania sp. WL0013]
MGGVVQSKAFGTGLLMETVKFEKLDDSMSQKEILEKVCAFLPSDGVLNSPWGANAKFIRAMRTWHDLLSAKRKPGRPYKLKENVDWYVKTICQYAAQVERSVKAGRTWEAVSFALDIGKLFGELRIKIEFEADAIKGRSLSDGQKAAAAARRKGPASERYELAEKYMQQGHSVRDSFARAAEVLDCSPSSVRRDHYEFRKRRSQS